MSLVKYPGSMALPEMTEKFVGWALSITKQPNLIAKKGKPRYLSLSKDILTKVSR